MFKNKFISNDSALTFDDVLLVPSSSDIMPINTNLEINLTSKINLKMPILSAAMDKVTESKMAIKMAQLGGMGIIHKNMPKEEQAHHVAKVKNFESGIIKNPITLKDSATLGEYFEARKHYGFSSFPVINVANKPVGFVSEKDIKFLIDGNIKITTIMTPFEQLIMVKEGVTLEQVKEKMQTNKIEQVLMIDNEGLLIGLFSSLGVVEANLYPQATRDSQSRLCCGAAIGTDEDEKLRVASLVEAGVDILVVDTAHGHSKNVKDMVEYIEFNYPEVEIIAGNIATYEAAKFLIEAGVDCLKVGVGSGSICTTRVISGVGMPQLSALLEVQRACEGTNVKFIADGGIKQSGDIAKALATGASAVMLGSLLAGTDETPGDIITNNGQSYKDYRGMGSISAMTQGSADRYLQGHSIKFKDKLVPEGVEARVLYKGSLQNIIHQLVGGLRASMGYTGCHNMEEFHTKTQFCRVTSAGLSESHVHGVQMVGDSPNYKKSC